VTIAVGGDEGGEEDGEVVADVDQGGREDGAEAQTHVGKDEGDAEEQDEYGPRVGHLLPVECGEENAGDDGREDEGGKSDLVGGVPEVAGRRGAGEREPVVGDGEGREEKATEEHLFEEGCNEGTEEGDDPDVGAGAEEVVHGDVLRHGRKGGDCLHGEGKCEADGDELDSVAAGGVEISVDAVRESALPEKRKEEPGDCESDQIGEGLGADEEFG